MIDPQIFNRVKVLVAGDKRDLISPWAFHASIFEEIGELAAALKVETGIVTHKTLDEAAKSEAVDVYICAAMMYFHDGLPEITGGHHFERSEISITISGTEYILAKCDVFQLLQQISSHVMRATESTHNYNNKAYHWLEAARHAIAIFFLMGGSDIEEFVAIGNKKLDKWAKNQADRNRIYSEPSEEKLNALEAQFDKKSWNETADGDKNLVKRPPLKAKLTGVLSHNVERIIEPRGN